VARRERQRGMTELLGLTRVTRTEMIEGKHKQPAGFCTLVHGHLPPQRVQDAAVDRSRSRVPVTVLLIPARPNGRGGMATRTDLALT
jgi:hypothetical protein